MQPPCCNKTQARSNYCYGLWILKMQNVYKQQIFLFVVKQYLFLDFKVAKLIRVDRFYLGNIHMSELFLQFIKEVSYSPGA